MTKVSLYDLYFVLKNISVLYSLGIPLCYVGTSVGDEQTKVHIGNCDLNVNLTALYKTFVFDL